MHNTLGLIKLLLVIVSLSGLGIPSYAQGKTQTLSISNLNNKKGKLYIGWYSGKETFREADKSAFKNIVEVNGKDSASVAFDKVPPGEYAIAVFFDVNGNGKMDTNVFGIPKEKYGFSNNVYPMMRAATFAESAIVIEDKEQTIRIRLH